MSPELYDKVHAAMVNCLTRNIQPGPGFPIVQPFPEFAYNHYGHRGSVDLLVYTVSEFFPQGHSRIEIYEVWSAVQRLEEALRKFNEKVEFAPEFFYVSHKPKEKLGFRAGHFVLLNSIENVAMIRDNWNTFEAEFFPHNQVGESTRGHFLVLLDPLNPKHMDAEYEVCLDLDLPKGVYRDSHDFWEKYQSKC